MDQLKKDLNQKEKILSKLNDQQRKAAINYHGPCAINAAPGSGKTSCLIARAAYMIEDGVSPYNILLFTFTRKAAQEIRDRVHAQIGEKAKGITVGTYHSFCMRILRQYGEALGWTSNFSIYDDEDKKAVLKPMVKEADMDLRSVAGAISRLKQNVLSPNQAAAAAENSYEQSVAQIYEKYMQKMKANNAFDFDDLIYYTIRLFEQHPDILENVNSKYKYITCDEAHDSSLEDLQLIEYLGGQSMNVCMILDCDQSIYSFRGADMSAVYEFMQIHDFQQFMLERNYRSTKTIVDAARSMISNNVEPFEKTVFTNNEIGPKVVYATLGDLQHESLQVIRTIKVMHKQGFPYKDIAVLYRMQFLSRNIEESLLRNSIPYKIVGGCPFYERKEIKDIVSYARFLLNPNDKEAFKRIINVPKRGIGNKTIERIFACQNTSSCDTIPPEGILSLCKSVTLKGKAKNAMDNFLAIIKQLSDFTLTHTPRELVDEIIRLTSYCEYLEETNDEKTDERIANLMELEEIASGYVDLQDFLNNMVLNTQAQEDEEDFDGVNLMTMHASKGLEFPVVIMIGANDGVIPHFKASMDGDVSEERRLFYVAMTRAKQFLFMTRSKIMPRAGIPQYYKQSRFIDEIAPQYLKKI